MRTYRSFGSVVFLVVLVLVVSACGSDDASDPSPAAAGTTTQPSAPDDGTEPDAPDATDEGADSTEPTAVRFDERGGYSVGTIDLELDPDHPLMVFYPADEVPDDARPFSYSGIEVFGEALADSLPGAFRDPQEIPDAWVEIPASEQGPFPVVLYSHGFAGYYRFSALHNAHLASHGYVVVSVDHPERGLLASFGGGGAFDGTTDVDQLLDGLELVEQLSATEDSILSGVADAGRVAAEGHSAGGRATGVAAYDERISAWIGQAPTPPVRRDPADAAAPSIQDFDFETWAADNEPPPVASLIIAADGDVAIPLAQVMSVFEWLAPPKWLVVLAGAGHNAFTDICRPIQQEGGLSATVEALGLDPDEVPIVRLGEDGCTEANPPVEDGWAVIDHLTVAFLNQVFEIDPDEATAGLDADWVEAEFPGLVASIDEG